MPPSPELLARARRVSLILFDVDGVLTDGRILLDAEGRESKRFHIRDGTAIVWARQAGLQVGFLSARTAAATSERARQLGVSIVVQGTHDKLTAYEAILADQRLSDDAVAFMGDDLLDLPVLNRVGVSAAPADAVPEVRDGVRFLSAHDGGAGAARELIELLLRAQDRWAPLVARYRQERVP
jgi:3-deoxy-D-manno-octulosonate 8-phosphate phosphatase (KDO 8-P phosphatase)